MSGRVEAHSASASLSNPQRRPGEPRRCIAGMAEYHGPVDPEQLARRLGLRPDQIAKLDGNENPYGPSQRVGEALSVFNGYHLYPDSEQRDLRAMIGEYIGLGPEHVMAGNGADEMIDLLMRAYLDPGDEVLDVQPSFGMYAFSAQQYDARMIVVERDDRWEVPLERALAALTPRTQLILLTSPNNPTGNRLPPEVVEALLASGRVVVVDEAYMEFSSGSIVEWVPRYENLVVLRTFSKWAGLAGLRIGYALLPLGIASHLWKLKPPFSVNQAAVVAVRESLADRAFLQENCRRIIAERGRLLEELLRISYLLPFPSEANFILCRVIGRDALELKLALQQRGILVRHYTHPHIRDCLRISVGRPEHTSALLAALREV